MVRLFSTIFADHKIRVNGLLPGLFPSEMVAPGSDKNTHASDLGNNTMGQDIPAGRPGDPRE
jgi:NAD(P)-dependent dehydrogenase (short-subunit alcohol dehydrogenase family)